MRDHAAPFTFPIKKDRQRSLISADGFYVFLFFRLSEQGELIGFREIVKHVITPKNLNYCL